MEMEWTRCFRGNDWFQDVTSKGLKRGATKQMGKFGVGLPRINLQAKKVEVYTWTDGGHETATYTYLDFDELSTFRTVPRPVAKIPEKWLQSSDIWDDSGTLVIWSKRRFSWKTSKLFTVTQNTLSAECIENTYRKIMLALESQLSKEILPGNRGGQIEMETTFVRLRRLMIG